MKFDRVILSGHQDIVLFDRNNPLSSPYVSKTIDGLAPTEANVNLAQTTQGTGLYIGRRPQLREITCNVHLNPDYRNGETPETLRQRLYMMRPITADGSLTFKLFLDGVEQARTPVYIKRMEMSPFSKDNLLQLVLASPREYFERPIHIHLTDPAFDKVHPVFPNEGSAPTGFMAQVTFTGPMTMFGYKRLEDDQQISIVHNFQTNDRLEIDTRIGLRGVWLYRGTGPRTSILGSMTADSSWVTLHPGDTDFDVLKKLNEPANFRWNMYQYLPQYLGV